MARGLKGRKDERNKGSGVRINERCNNQVKRNEKRREGTENNERKVNE